MEPLLRLREHLRQDDPRLASGVSHRGRAARRNHARGHICNRHGVPHARIAPANGQLRRGHAARPPGPCRRPGQHRNARGLPVLEVRTLLRADRRPLVDRRPVRDPGFGGPSGQPGHGRRGAFRQAANRSRKARGPRDRHGRRVRVPGRGHVRGDASPRHRPRRRPPGRGRGRDRTLGRADRPSLRIGGLGPGAVRRPGRRRRSGRGAVARRIRDQRLLERGAGPADTGGFVVVPLDREPPAPCRPVRLALAGARCRRDRGLVRRRGRRIR